MKVDVLLGLQWGDEGKGKIVDVLTPQYDIIARFQGGPNAGHTLNFEGEKVVLHTIPSGIFRKNSINIIGNGVIIDPYIMIHEEIKTIQHLTDVKSKLYISEKAHLILPTHRWLDYVNESTLGQNKIGSTLKGIGPTYTDKVRRCGIRVGDLFLPGFKDKYTALRNRHLQQISDMGFDIDSIKLGNKSFSEYEQLWLAAAEELKQYQVCSTEYLINKALAEGKKVLAEGAQGSLLDVEFGSYPFVTSSCTITAGVSPNKIGKVYGLFKAYCTRVGEGPFPTELFDSTGEELRQKGGEFGSTTGRPRRCGWLDLPHLRYACMLDGVTELIMMKADVLNGFDELKVCTSYSYNNRITDEIPFDPQARLVPQYQTLKGWKAFSGNEIPSQMKDYIAFVEQYVGLKVKIVSVGPDRNENIVL